MRLIISPHADDEVLGCSSVLDNAYVVFLGINDFHIVDKKTRISELTKARQFFNYNNFICDHLVDNYKFQNILDTVQVFINKLKPDEIYIPHPSYNQDHRTVYEACFTALRHHDKNFLVKKVLVYEEIHHNLWDKEEFNPNYFVKLDIDKKIEGYKLHTSQVRSHRSPEMIKLMAKFRGYQSGYDYAEAFKILRWIN
jgi:LmbE family N-acetylglucosaminyl deacetylase